MGPKPFFTQTAECPLVSYTRGISLGLLPFMPHLVPSPVKPILPLGILCQLIPNISRSSWKLKGICKICELCSHNLLKPFTTLQTEYKLPTSNFFKYLQITHCLLRNSHIFKQISGLAWHYLTSSNPAWKDVSLFYDILQNKSAFHKLSTK